jgi:hypothetical protein
LFLDRTIYRRVDNVILAADDGSTTQIDHLLVSRFSIFVIETKNMKGWIFGRAGDPRWTQVLFGHKYRFQNPLRQNFRHTCVVAEKLNVQREAVHGIVFFIGDCRFKTPIPDGVFCSGVASHIRSHRYEWFFEDEVERLERRLRDIKQHSRFTGGEHVRLLRERYDSETTCPKCGCHLVERVARKGSRAGERFLGCSAYPKCRYVRTR